MIYENLRWNKRVGLQKMIAFATVFFLYVSCNDLKDADYLQISGIYPHLAYYNQEDECGIGAVVPWADRLWVTTYGPHLPFGSSDKLYEITLNLDKIVHPESIGGTPANRMIHIESKQLFIGPYAIDSSRNVRVVPYSVMPGRLTGTARHLREPADKIYYGTMEEGFYEVDVRTLDVTSVYPDGNLLQKEGDMAQSAELLPGAHGKGLYSGQGVLVYTNNGEATQQALTDFSTKSGALVEWDGENWKLIRRNQFTEVTGPGGIYGNATTATDPIWTVGWDYKSLILGVRSAETGWDFYRLPKASHSYDGAHGWNTEWPRIRNVGTKQKPEYLMTMHGMFWHFPETFTSKTSAGLRPRSAYLKVIGDFTRWNGELVFGCDDAAHKEFLNTRGVKGNIEGPGQSNSNLWFTPIDKPDKLGPITAGGAVWISEEIKAGEYSEPFLFAGWDIRSVWLQNEGQTTISFSFEVDKEGNNIWSPLKSIELKKGESTNIAFSEKETGEWVRVLVNKATKATVYFNYTDKEVRSSRSDSTFSGLADIRENGARAGLLWNLGEDRFALGVVAGTVNDADFKEYGYYELDANMKLLKKEDPKTASFIREKCAIPRNVVTVDDASVLIVDDRGRRWRLPKGDEKYTGLIETGLLRLCREVSTERDIFNCSGTFYELPAENADGFAKIRPIASHHFRIYDYASYRGLLIMTGLQSKLPVGNDHIICSQDGKAALWAGAIDDLWKLGKPNGRGGPWNKTEVKAGKPSDAYLIGFYDTRRLELSHQSSSAVTFSIEVEPIGHGPWMKYKKVTLKPGEMFKYVFPDSFQSRWIRFVADTDCRATAWLIYE